MPFRIALSGLNAASTDLEVIGNNIANSATNGFKESRAEFGDVFDHALADLAFFQFFQQPFAVFLALLFD